MCYWCHRLDHNIYAPSHSSTNCKDIANTHSKVPMSQRTVDTSSSTCRHCQVMINMATHCRKCEGKQHRHCWECHKDKPKKNMHPNSTRPVFVPRGVC